MNQQEERYASLDYLVKDFIQSIQGSTTDWQERQLKKFLQSEINLALVNRDKEIVEKRDAIWNMLCEMDTNIKSEKEYASDIINLITKANKE